MNDAKHGTDIPRLLDANVDLMEENRKLRDINKDLLEALQTIAKLLRDIPEMGHENDLAIDESLTLCDAAIAKAAEGK